eukprot:6358641-Prymnesium_polylepis.1
MPRSLRTLCRETLGALPRHAVRRLGLRERKLLRAAAVEHVDRAQLGPLLGDVSEAGGEVLGRGRAVPPQVVLDVSDRLPRTAVIEHARDAVPPVHAARAEWVGRVDALEAVEALELGGREHDDGAVARAALRLNDRRDRATPPPRPAGEAARIAGQRRWHRGQHRILAARAELFDSIRAVAEHGRHVFAPRVGQCVRPRAASRVAASRETASRFEHGTVHHTHCGLWPMADVVAKGGI